jgi:ATPase subunit of ABC transporter with duplicated ATPase domains
VQLERARIKNFRSLKDVEVAFGTHTALIGGNGAGKSSILKAIETFYSTSKTCDADDFFGRDQTQPIEIELTFHQLSDHEIAAFEERVRDGKLVVTRIFDQSPSSGRYHGVVPQNPDFVAIRAHAAATPKRAASARTIQSMLGYRQSEVRRRSIRRFSIGKQTIQSNSNCSSMMVSFLASKTTVGASFSNTLASFSSLPSERRL